MIAFAGQQAGQAGQARPGRTEQDRTGQDRTRQDRTEQGGKGQGTVTVTDQDPGSRKMSVVKGSEDENREGVGMDGSRVVKIFELDAAQGFVGLGWLCNCSALTAAATTRKRRRKKKGATSAHGKRPSGSATAETSKRQQQQEAAGAAAVATGAGTVRE